MKIYARLIPTVSKEILDVLRKDEDIEVDDGKLQEAELDIGAVMRQYIEEERNLNNDVKDYIFKRKLDYKDFKRAKEMISREKKFPLGDDGIDFVLNQIIEALMMSKNIDEVFSEDNVLRRKMLLTMKKHFELDAQFDLDVRARMKNLQEGTPQWDIEYEKQLAELKRIKGFV